MKKTITVAVYMLLTAGMFINAYFMLSNGEPDKLWWWPLAFGFYAWAAVPFAGVAIVNRYLSKNLLTSLILFATAVTITGGGLYILVEAFITHLDPQSGIIFIFLPFLQCVVVAIGTGLVLLIRTLGNEKSPTMGSSVP
jgi:hypothetical protein